ncbi:Tyrosine-protein phosphatase 1-like protein [Cladobotryum mycophilum]|uniref:protein-tyrosine-phosphatase n=1 Tax=Cladobotryum mycophilum TaxID=491253 RepID=A0ABR0T052_9HYPO
MKTHTRPSPGLASSHSHSHSHARSLSQSSRTGKVNKSTTPASSPWPPYSVGQNYPPKHSPVRPPEMRAPSPNYFGLVVESGHDPRDSSGLGGGNWSPSSSIKSFAAALPKHVSLESNPEFEAFKRQADLNRGMSFPLPTAHYTQPLVNPAPVRPRPPRWHTHASDTSSDTSFTRSLKMAKERQSARMDVDQESLHDSAYVSSDSKRNSESSLFPLQITSLPRFESPQPMNPAQQRTNLTRAEDRDPRLSLMEHRPEPPSPRLMGSVRSETLPPTLEPGQPAMISGPQLKDLMEIVDEDRVLLLDIRSSQNFGLSRIQGALNICVPTTLLKRATCNIEKLKQFFQGGSEFSKIAAWRDMEWIIVYDAQSSDKKDAVTAQNMIKKFTNEGYTGNTGILRGGFNAFQGSHPELVDYASLVEKSGDKPSCAALGGLFAPVIGGVVLPTTANAFNPFFSNIRQNMDLADGVGQLDISSDHGKKVSDKFLHIEREEQSRMKSAYAAFNQGKAGLNRTIQLSGNKPEGSCDYVNASHLTASRSNKRYIASQGPLPDTFEDFWSVVWEQDVRVIVMLTAETEGGQMKCHSYWKSREFGPIRLRQQSEKKVSLELDKSKPSSASELSRRRANTTTTVEGSTTNGQSPQGQAEPPYVIIRTFAISHSAHPFAPLREVTHLHFPSWPDFGTPAQPSHLLALVELANVIQRAALPVETASVVGSSKAASDGFPLTWYDEPEKESAARPMLVHCSAGCGRTGTFCTVDSVIDMLKRHRLAKASKGHSYFNGMGGGDVYMADSDDAISPLTEKEMNGKQSATLENGKSEPSKLDTAWLNDDSVDLIQKTVEDFREQRISMVQSLRQFVLCYETVLEWVNRVNDRGTTAPGGRRRSGSLLEA